MGKQVKNYWIALALIFLQLLCGCSSSDDETPDVALSDISGVWLEYAYLCSDGYFVDISNTGYNMYYEFLKPNIFNQYTIVDGNKDYHTQGTWTFNPETSTAIIKEPRGWDLSIKFDFASNENATLYIIGKTQNSNQIVKVKRTSK